MEQLWDLHLSLHLREPHPPSVLLDADGSQMHTLVCFQVARFPEYSQSYGLGLLWRRVRPSHHSLASADFCRIHVFVLPAVALCKPIHHDFRSTNMAFRAQDGDRTSLLQLELWSAQWFKVVERRIDPGVLNRERVSQSLLTSANTVSQTHHWRLTYIIPFDCYDNPEGRTFLTSLCR